jgi:para-aminobenzoate synthetase component 1
MPSLEVIELPYEVDSAPLMKQLGTLPQPVFLDSCAHSQDPGRYDILSALPAASLVATNGVVKCSEALPEAAANEVLSALEYLHNRYRSTDDPALEFDWPFKGGILGYLGYPQLTHPNQPQILNACLGVYLWAVIIDHQTRQSHLFFLPSCSQDTRARVKQKLAQEIRNTSLNFNLLEGFDKDVSRAEYDTSFDAIKQYIRAGDCYQVNLTQRLSSHYSGQPLAAYLRLRNKGGKPFSAFLAWHDKALLSLSPERFLRTHNNAVTTQPIKGTRARGATPEEDRALARELLSSSKDQAENLMIVDLLRNDLGKVCETGSITALPLFELQSFSNVHHLVSTVSGTLKSDCNSLDLIKNCFPGGSITGAPKLRAMQVIEELEAFSRQIYCGSVFYMSFDGNIDSNITIRSLMCDNGDIYCWTGGGIVSDSDCDQEYLECFDKIQHLINILEQ